MAITELQVNTNNLKQDHSNMAAEMTKVKQTLTKLYDDVKELDRVWEGEAKNEFSRQFAADKERIAQICDEISKFLDSLSKANADYEKCESAVGSIVAAIRI
jgi:WXG100 family type VII secretion target